ncbi:MAG: hypothetical protein JSS36_11635 [Proteobacteria bacterium]|nr:hypothetical protein [Pseudomonadota bacterium]
MIAARPQPDFDQLLAALEAQVRAEAEAAAQNRALARAADPLRWRRPGLLWPGFTKG